MSKTYCDLDRNEEYICIIYKPNLNDILVYKYYAYKPDNESNYFHAGNDIYAGPHWHH